VKFVDFPLLESIHQDIRRAGYERPLPIQVACIPPALEGKDVIGLAQTGTGKTAAFAIPIIQRLAGRADLGALVLAPTRELAAQITDAFNQLGASSGVRVATIVGGVPLDRDHKALRSWPNVLVATPGRLIDHIDNGKVLLAEIEVLVVDEADRMHDMGFIPQIRRILSALPRQRQTMMFTATLPSDVERIARRSMRDPVRIQIGQMAPAHRARQELFELGEDTKGPLLLKLLRASRGRVLVFVRTKRGVDRLARRVNSRGFSVGRIHGDLEQNQRVRALADFRHGRRRVGVRVEAIHGDKSQGARERALSAFKKGTIRVLVATDIAARGLDISDIEHVINYDFPRHPEDYVHRIGRTARVDASGLATSFATGADHRYVNDVRRLIGEKLPVPTRLEGYAVPAPRAATEAKARGGYRPGRRGGAVPGRHRHVRAL